MFFPSHDGGIFGETFELEDVLQLETRKPYLRANGHLENARSL